MLWDPKNFAVLMVKIVLFLVLFVTEIIVGSGLFYIIAITEENFINQY